MGSLLENMETIARTQFTKAQADAIAENIAIAWYNAVLSMEEIKNKYEYILGIKMIKL
jgi:hypothetical protein